MKLQHLKKIPMKKQVLLEQMKKNVQTRMKKALPPPLYLYQTEEGN